MKIQPTARPTDRPTARNFFTELFIIILTLLFTLREMEYRVIKSKFGNDLLYVPSEKILYKSKGRGDDFECYQRVLSDPKKVGHEMQPRCGSGVRRLTDTLCERIHAPHTDHANHEVIAADKERMNNMVSRCEDLKIHHREDAHRIPNRHIFQREISK